MCGWLATIARTSPSSSTRAAMSVVDKADGVPQQVAGRRTKELRLLTDADRRCRRDRLQVGLEVGDLGMMAVRHELVERGPQLTLGRHPLALIGADRTHLDPVGVLDGAGLTDPKSLMRPR